MAIHQPNFFPWLGYFDKIRRSDIFIFLDDVQAPKTGGSYINRVRAMSPVGETWLSAPVKRSYSGVMRVMDLDFAVPDWQLGFMRKIHSWYKTYPFFFEVDAFLTSVLETGPTRIAAFNIEVITSLCRRLGFEDTQFTVSSTLPNRPTSNEGLCALISQFGGDIYLSGEGARAYFESQVFEKHGISVIWQGPITLRYPQQGREGFASGLSIIDCIMNVGLSGARRLYADDFGHV